MRKLGLLLLFTAAPGFGQGLIIDGQGTATLTWTPPSEYTNGDPLPASEIAGYVIYFGEQSCGGQESRPDSLGNSSCYPGRVNVSDGNSTSTPITLRLTGDATIYFAVATVATNGQYSAYSNEDSKAFVLVIDDQRQPGNPVIVSVDITILCTTNNPDVTCTFNVQ